MLTHHPSGHSDAPDALKRVRRLYGATLAVVLLCAFSLAVGPWWTPQGGAGFLDRAAAFPPQGPLVLSTVIFCAVAVQFFFVWRPAHIMLRRARAVQEARGRQIEDLQQELENARKTLLKRGNQVKKEQARLRNALENAALICGEQAAFTYSVSHDLKSPANTLQLILDELIHEHTRSLNKDGLTLLNHAQESITLMSSLIEDVLQYSWATDPNEKPRSVTLSDSVHRAMTALRPRISQTKAKITLGRMERLTAAPKQIDLLMQHLISNALMFQPAGQRPVIHIDSAPGERAGTIVLTVKDNGIGVAPEDRLRIFGLFQRLHLREKYPGSGLGLATCQRIAANHGGSIHVRSTPGEGAVFEVMLGPLLSEQVKLTSMQAA